MNLLTDILRRMWTVLRAYADQWALITGASSGIGAEFARQLAARGMHLILTARREDLLQKLADEVHQAHGTKTEIIVCDLNAEHGPAQLMAEVDRRGKTVELLVNNAGFGVVGEVDTVDPNRIMEMIRLNITVLTDLCYRALPGMLSRGHGGVINVASVAAFQPVAYMGAYAASKAYVLHLTESLWAECRERGVTVTALCPGTTKTEFFDVAGAPEFLKRRSSQEVKPVVKAALKALEQKRQYIVSGWTNYILSLLVRLATRRTVVRESMKFFRPDPKDRPTAS